MSDDNDIRATLGMLVRSQTDIAAKLDQLAERLDDVGALAVRSARLAELCHDLDAIVEALPGAIRKLSEDPAIGMLMGGQLHEMAASIEQAVAHRRELRSSAPGIEG